MSMNAEVLQRLQKAGLLSEQTLDLGNVPTGSYALNKIISGDYQKGIPIGMITQIHGEASTAKTVFATHILKEAQQKGYYTVLIDSENAYNPEFAKRLGIDLKKLIYAAPQTLEDCFQTIHSIIMEIRELDEDTPIVIAYDSIAVSPSKSEYEAEGFDGNNMVGAIRAKSTGACLRKINPILRLKKVALVVINQIRSKVGVIYGDPTTMAAGGKSLEFYLGVNLRTSAPKSGRIVDENKRVVGIRGEVKNTKNKVALPFQDCEYELRYNIGLSSHYGLLGQLVLDGLVTREGAWYSYEGTKFQTKTFLDRFLIDEKFAPLRSLVGINNKESIDE